MASCIARIAAASQVPLPHITMRTSVLFSPAAFRSTRVISLSVRDHAVGVVRAAQAVVRLPDHCGVGIIEGDRRLELAVRRRAVLRNAQRAPRQAQRQRRCRDQIPVHVILQMNCRDYPANRQAA
ncbi:hypothetical protein G6F68_013730 [Rhizopus microsporus]|nr:hypothetical protein G6F68_013730 [Rhizopus microsporus]